MEHQNQILQTLRAPESQARLERIVAQEALNNRAAVGRRVCAEFGFVDARGSAQLAGCLKALNTLHKVGRIALPASRGGGGAPTPQRFDAPVAAATAVPGTVEAVAGLSLERVEQGRQRRVWNTLLHFEHPQGTTTFAGCQVRYLVVSAHGVLGAVGFSASALHLRAREAWQGGQLRVGRAHGRSRAPGPRPCAGSSGQVGIYVRVGAALAAAVGGGAGRRGAGAGAG